MLSARSQVCGGPRKGLECLADADNAGYGNGWALAIPNNGYIPGTGRGGVVPGIPPSQYHPWVHARHGTSGPSRSLRTPWLPASNHRTLHI